MSELRYKLHLFGRNGTVNFALSGIESPLGYMGKATGMAVHQLLGGAHRLEFKSYASLLSYKDPELVARIAVDAVARGYGAIKLHEIELARSRRRAPR